MRARVAQTWNAGENPGHPGCSWATACAVAAVVGADVVVVVVVVVVVFVVAAPGCSEKGSDGENTRGPACAAVLPSIALAVSLRPLLPTPRLSPLFLRCLVTL